MSPVDVPPTNPGQKQQIIGFALQFRSPNHITVYQSHKSFISVEDTTAGQAGVPQNQGRKQRAKPTCSVCKNPMKGHKNIANCPKNQR